MDTNNKPERMPPVERLASLFTAPAKLMENIKFYPTALIPILICMAVIILYLPVTARFTAMVFEQSLPELRAALKAGGMTEDAVDMFIEQTRTVNGSSSVQPLTAAAALIVPPVTALISALGMMLLCKVGKSKAAFNQYFSMYAYLLIISTAGSIAVTAINLAMRNQVNALSLEIFAPNTSSVLSIILSSVSLHGLWVNFLAVVGLKVINDWTVIKSVVFVAVGFVLSTAASVLLTVLPGMIL